MKRIAIIGSGISGVSSAYYLQQAGFQVSVFEGADYFGGHTHTVPLELEGQKFKVDTGFLVHNDRTYPNLIQFFDELGIETHPSEMSFSVDHKRDDILWAGTSLSSLFVQKRNVTSFRFWKFLREILRFNKESAQYLEYCEKSPHVTLGDLLEMENYSKDFCQWYLLPMGGCIWSSPIEEMIRYPARTFLTFCMNHGLLQIFNRPQWKTIVGGCATYTNKVLEKVEDKRLGDKVTRVESVVGGVEVHTESGCEVFDYCIMSCHAPDAVKMLKTKNMLIPKLLSNFKYQKNYVALHSDESLLPADKKAWAAWNYMAGVNEQGQDAISVSYLINELQPLPIKGSVVVSLNPHQKIDPNKIILEREYFHPLFNSDAIMAQEQIESIQGADRGIFYCGAWQRYGFHEDGILSAKKAINHILKLEGLQEIEVR